MGWLGDSMRGAGAGGRGMQSSTGSSSASGSSSTAVRLNAGPAAATAVTPFAISASGLPPSGLVTVQARTADHQGRPWESAGTFRASRTGTLDLASAVPVSGSYHTADVGGLLWSLHPAFSTGPDTGFVASRIGFAVQLTVLTGGHVRAGATLKRLLPATSSTPTVAKDGFAATFYPPVSARPGAPAIVVIGGYPDDEDIPVVQGLAMSGSPRWQSATSTSRGCRSASAPPRWNTSPVPSAGCAPSQLPADVRSSCTAGPTAPRPPCCSPPTSRI